MKIMKCADCHHEWAGSNKTCDWCFSEKEAIVLKEKYEFEELLNDFKHKIMMKSQTFWAEIPKFRK